MVIGKPPGQFDWAKDIPCKNITIYGYCKHQDKCAYKHDIGVNAKSSPAVSTTLSTVNNNNNNNNNNNSSTTTTTTSTATATTSHQLNTAAPTFIPSNVSRPTSSSTTTFSTPSSSQTGTLPKKKFNFDSPSFTPNVASNSFNTPPPNPKDVPTFVPNSTEITENNADNHYHSDGKNNVNSTPTVNQVFNFDTPSFTPSFTPNNTVSFANNVHHNPDIPLSPAISHTQPSTTAGTSIVNPYSTGNGLPQNEIFFAQPTTAYPLQYHLYAPVPPPHMQLPLQPNERNAQSLFIPNDLREKLQLKNEASLQVLPHSKLPQLVDVYHSLVPIDQKYEKSARVYGVPSSLYKVCSNIDGNLYALRRLEGVKHINESAIASVKRWQNVKSANVVKLYLAFTNMAFNDNSLFLVYDYYPCSSTLLEAHFQPSGIRKPEIISENILWSYIVQLTNALVAIHEKGLAARTIDLSKVIITNKGRIRLSGCGVLDILNYGEDKKLEELQKIDLENFTKLIFDLAASSIPTRGIDKSQVDIVKLLPFSDNFKNVLIYMISDLSNLTLSKLQSIIAPQIMQTMNDLENANDYIEGQLTRELENSRLVRLMIKLGFINERPGFANDPSWSETGDRYPIKLFRDYVFHQVDENGKAVVDLSHVLSCLNKLDAGIDETILLVSPDEKSCVIASYKKLKEIVDAAFRDLSK
ncbi:hypothetical protein PACTADRAFT_3705 [Pachysolen tannophilus NRRL Y-2460]|uniref:PAN2-PAN3 deadenylation complex subunit PAN3 n=1 Tax=Pachysolen tannophilus NRRL Y-2460 TaxID=669874 RepID=A0A1E4TST6_PACTA|nr:hypothetical protein PACTADRAFT_3705 [Pachysolen tannophilus NRRL Y-2460]